MTVKAIIDALLHIVLPGLDQSHRHLRHQHFLKNASTNCFLMVRAATHQYLDEMAIDRQQFMSEIRHVSWQVYNISMLHYYRIIVIYQVGL